MLSRSLVVAALLAVAYAGPCKPTGAPTDPPPNNPSESSTATPTQSATPTLPDPKNPTATLPAPPSGQKLLKIAVGHGIQNYTCASTSANVTSFGALAVLYDVTALYPGQGAGSMEKQSDFDALSHDVLYGQDIPLNLQNPDEAGPGGANAPNAGSEANYGAVKDNPFIAPADANVGGRALPFLGRHYFDGASSPTFDLTAASLVASVKKGGGVAAPGNSDKGVLGTGAVDWLQLIDNGKGLGKGVQTVYRVITAGGVSQTCAQVGVPEGSVPYTAFYWFFG